MHIVCTTNTTHTLGGFIHLEMLMHESPREALENRSSLEIARRRLFAILYVEEAVNKAQVRDRASAWQYVHIFHESVPMGTVMCDNIDDTMTHRMNQEKKRTSALKTINEARPARQSHHHDSRGNTNRGNRRPELQDLQDRHGRHDRRERQKPGTQAGNLPPVPIPSPDSSPQKKRTRTQLPQFIR